MVARYFFPSRLSGAISGLRVPRTTTVRFGRNRVKKEGICHSGAMIFTKVKSTSQKLCDALRIWRAQFPWVVKTQKPLAGDYEEKKGGGGRGGRDDKMRGGIHSPLAVVQIC